MQTDGTDPDREHLLKTLEGVLCGFDQIIGRRARLQEAALCDTNSGLDRVQ